MTPRQFHLLWGRHREELLHREMVGAFTTAAVINFSFTRPKDPAQPKDFMPNLKEVAEKPVVTGDLYSSDVMDDYKSRRAQIAALLERYQVTGEADPYLVQIGLVHG